MPIKPLLSPHSYSLLVILLAASFSGCGTTRWSDTARTGTEQLLLTGAVEKAVGQISFEVLAGQPVFLDAQYLDGLLDKGFIISTIRQQMVAQGCILKSDVKEAKYVVEARAMSGTNRQDLLFGIPQTSLPNMNVPGVPTNIPEISFAKSTAQKGVAKVAVFAYSKDTGQAVWQSGSNPVASTAKDVWVLGTGPWQNGSIYSGTRFAGGKINPFNGADGIEEQLNVTTEQIFDEGRRMAQKSEPQPLQAPPASEGESLPASAEKKPDEKKSEEGNIQPLSGKKKSSWEE
ncbi:MAG: DUF6655 family protein [Planctomycetales bacterium]